jgi:hypothetical protein
MYDPFELPIMYKGQEILLPAQLFQHGYIHHFQVEVNGELLLFERDDEGSFRALIDPEKAQSSKIDRGLFEAIIKTLDQLLA